MKVRKLFPGLMVFIVLLFLPITGLGSTLRLEKALGRISPYTVTGFNFGNWMRVYDLKESFSKIDIGILRFPAGNYGDEHDRTPSELDFLKMQLSFLGYLPLIMQARLFGGVTGSGTPEDAVTAARYADELGLDIRYWEIGNEPDLYATHRGGPSWTPERYCQEFRRFAKALHVYDPTIKLAGPAISQGGTPVGDRWIRTFIHECGDLVDLLTWHFYPTDGTWSDAAALATSSAVSDQIRRYRAWLKDPKINPKGYERPIALGITEFGLSWQTNCFRHLTDMTAALWTADVLGQMATSGLAVGVYFALQDTGGHGLIDTAGWKRPTYWVFRLLKSFTGVAYAVASSSPDLHAYAAFNNGELRLLLINLASNTATFRIGWGEFSPTDTASLSVFDRETYDVAEGIHKLTIAPLGKISLPSRSVGMLVVQMKKEEK